MKWAINKGIFNTFEKAQLHINGVAKKVVISAPSQSATNVVQLFTEFPFK